MNALSFVLLFIILHKISTQSSLFVDVDQIKDNEIYNKFKLRGMYKERERQIYIAKEREMEMKREAQKKSIQNIIFVEHKNIFDNVLKKASNGKNCLYFRILCGPNSVSSYDGQKREHKMLYDFDNHNILNTRISVDFFDKFNDLYSKDNVILSILEKLNISFPDSNITSWKNLEPHEKEDIKCNIYKISW